MVTNKNLEIIKPTKAEQLLINVIRQEIEQGKQRALNAMEKEKHKTYWNIGKHIKEDFAETCKQSGLWRKFIQGFNGEFSY